MHPALGAVPFDGPGLDTGGQTQGGGGLRHRQAPQAQAVATGLQAVVLLLAQAVPEGLGDFGRQAFAAELAAGILDGGTRAAQAQPQALASALLKLYEDNASTLTPDPLYARFYYSHPPAVERLAQLGSAT